MTNIQAVAVKSVNQSVVKKEGNNMNMLNASTLSTPSNSVIRDAIRAIQALEGRITLEEHIDLLADLLLEYPAELNPDKVHADLKREELVISPLCAEFEHVLMDYILQLKNLTEYSSKAQAKDCTLLGYRRAGAYGGLEFYQCMIHAKKRFGLLDVETGEKVPFMKHFNWLLKWKRKNILEKDVMELDSVTHDMRQREVHELLQDAYEAKGMEPGQALEGYISQDRAGKLLDELEADEELRKAVKAAFSKNYADASDATAKQGEDTVKVSGADRAQAGSYWEAKCTADRLLYMLEQGEKLTQRGTKNVRQDYVPYITLKSIEYLGGFKSEERTAVVEQLDKELLRFVLEGNYEHDKAHRDQDAEAYAAYLGIAYDTARKRLNKVAAVLETIGGKSRRASVEIAKQKRKAKAKAEAKAKADAKVKVNAKVKAKSKTKVQAKAESTAKVKADTKSKAKKANVAKVS